MADWVVLTVLSSLAQYLGFNSLMVYRGVYQQTFHFAVLQSIQLLRTSDVCVSSALVLLSDDGYFHRVKRQVGKRVYTFALLAIT